MTEPEIVSGRTTLFLSGSSGAGKTTLAVRRLHALREEGVPGDSIAVFAPQRSLLLPFQVEMERAMPGSHAWLLTIGGLARQMVDLFWPAVSRAAGFARPAESPVFLTLETAQYYMARVVRPLIEGAGYFEGVRLQRPRLYSQILDNLNKAALVGFPHTEIGERLKSAWSGEARRAVVFTQAQDAAIRFRQYCLQNNLLDFSLQVEILSRHLLTADWFRDYLFGQYRHLIADNVEEEPPVTHDLLRDWLPHCESALLVYDDDAGYRSFLGADPKGALALRDACRQHVELAGSHVTSPDLQALAKAMAQVSSRRLPLSIRKSTVQNALGYGGGKFHPQMLDGVTDEIVRLSNEEGIPPGEIVVLAPFLSDALRFALADRLARRNIQTHSLRPSRALNDEPAARCLLTLAALAHPGWNLTPATADVAHALSLSVDGLDVARAHLLAQRVYVVRGGAAGESPVLRPFDGLNAELQDRIGFDLGGRYATLCRWLDGYRAAHAAPLDHFLSRLFGEVISQPGFGFHRDLDAGRVAAGLIASARKFRQVVAADDIGPAYIEMVQSGVIAAQQYERLQVGGQKPASAVLLAPAYTFLLSNQAADVQFWINAGSPGWWERLYQPLTHPFVLTRHWPAGRAWTDEDEQAARQLTLSRLTQGLLRRCRKKIYLAFSALNEQGFEERGPLLMRAQQILRRTRD